MYKWSARQEEAFQKPKEYLCIAPALAYPLAGEKFILDTDASGFGIGGVFS